MSLQTSSTDLINAMLSVQTYLYQFGSPIFIVLGTLDCILNITVFTQKNVRKNPCSIYFIAYNLANFLYIYSSLLGLTMVIGYGINPSAKYLTICRLHFYATLLLNVLSPFYLVLASIDRILITSSNVLTRRRSTLRLSYTCTLIGTVFWAILHSHALILANIIQIGSDNMFCYFQQGIYLSIMGYYSIMKEILSLLLMIIFGLWAIKNIQSVRRVRVNPGLPGGENRRESNLYSNSSKDRQLMFYVIYGY